MTRDQGSKVHKLLSGTGGECVAFVTAVHCHMLQVGKARSWALSHGLYVWQQ